MTKLPAHGTGWSELERQMKEAAAQDVDWRSGRSPAYIHFGGDDVLNVAKQAYLMFFSENGLGQRAFGSLARFEADVVAMGLDLLGGDAGARGAMTTGGTESIFLAVKAARDFACRRRPARAKPQIILPFSAHPAFDKAAHFLGLSTLRVPLRPDFSADPQAMAEEITPDTIMLVGSAPAYPHGVMDPIDEIAAVAQSRSLWMHVDACVGGYFAPFARKLGYPVEAFDFTVPGVTSISADLHKYGYAAKGASTLFFRDPESFAQMEYRFDNWPRGQYSTRTLVGTRGGGAIAAAWAVMHYLGEEGYLKITERVIATRRAIEEGLRPLGLHAFGRPELAILAYGSADHDMASLSRGLGARGWLVGNVTNPDGIHLMLNLTHEPVVGQYLSDVAAALQDARSRLVGDTGAIDASY